MKKRQLLATALLALTTPAIAAQQLLERATDQSQQEPSGSWEGFMQSEPVDQFITLTIASPAEGGGGTLQVLGRDIPLTEAQWSGNELTARIGSGRGGVVIQARSERDLLMGELRQGERVQPFSLRRIPPHPAPADRQEAWCQDLHALTARFLTLDRSFSAGERALFLEAVEAVRADLHQLDDSEIIMRMAAAVALANEPHTRLLLLRNATRLRRLPVRVWWFSDGLYVVRTAPEYRHLLGCRIDDFAGVEARHARDLVGAAFAGNPYWRDYMTTYSLTSPEALHGFGVVRDMETIELGVSLCAGAPRRSLRPMPLASSDRTVEAWWDLSPVRENPHGMTEHVLGTDPARLPLYLRNAGSNYWFEYLPVTGILYFQYNRAQNSGDENMERFGERLLSEFAARRPRALVVDLRFNTGGDAGVARGMLAELQNRARGLPVYVITGRATFSAGISSLAQLLEAGPATIVGEPAGDDLDHWSEGGYIKLPNSGIEADFQSALHSYSTAPCPPDVPCFVDMSIESIAPSLRVSVSWKDYRKRRDPVMTAIEADLRARDGG